jgi:colicin import membrane protein
MPRKLKTYQTSQGFYDLAIAAPSMKAALKAWGTSRNLFHHGFAKESHDSEVVAAAMAKPGIVLKRPVGSDKPFREHADLPTAASLDAHLPASEAPRKQPPAPKVRRVDEQAELRAAAAFANEDRKRERQRNEEQAAAAKVRARRKAAVHEAERALRDARRDHEVRGALIEKDRVSIERREEAEEERWQKLKSRLETALRKAAR